MRSNSRTGRAPRNLNEDDVSGWMKAAEKPIGPVTQDDLRRHMRRVNFVRWRRLQKDFRWMMREMKKLGLNPEDARWLP